MREETKIRKKKKTKRVSNKTKMKIKYALNKIQVLLTFIFQVPFRSLSYTAREIKVSSRFLWTLLTFLIYIQKETLKKKKRKRDARSLIVFDILNFHDFQFFFFFSKAFKRSEEKLS